jgi:hypothetical protein
MNVYGHSSKTSKKLTVDLDALVERTHRPGHCDPSAVASTRSKIAIAMLSASAR